jgi:glyoxylase-like metal-dependent hydrolase (beta-lactamase superfamily II)
MKLIKEFFDKDTFTLTYVLYDQSTRDAIVIDPVWDYDPASSQVSTASAELVMAFLKQEQLKVHFILDTHAHADHISGSQVLKNHLPAAKVGIGKNITKVQSTFKSIYNFDPNFPSDGSQFDVLLVEGKTYQAGSLSIQVLNTPGHTPACCSYVIDDFVFTGDALFMPDFGTGRCDFPGGSASDLYDSIQKLYKLPESSKVYTGHDYQPNGRPLRFQSTIGEQKKDNIHINADTSKDDYVKFRTDRDKTLSAPRLLLPSLQINIDGGHLPPTEPNGLS